MRLFSAAMAAAVLLGAGASGSAPASPATGEQFFATLLGEWVGTAQQRVDDQEPLTRYFHLAVRRRDAQTFVTTIRYYRPNPKTGALEEAGSERGTSSLQPDGTVQRRLEGTGTVLVNYRPKPETHSAAGSARPTAGGLEGEASGTIKVDGLPFGLGRRGRIEQAREEWSVRGGVLSGRTTIRARFRALFTTRRFKVETTCRGERGSDVAAVAAKRSAKRASSR
jgi:hypothetical protein